MCAKVESNKNKTVLKHEIRPEQLIELSEWQQPPGLFADDWLDMLDRIDDQPNAEQAAYERASQMVKFHWYRL